MTTQNLADKHQTLIRTFMHPLTAANVPSSFTLWLSAFDRGSKTYNKPAALQHLNDMHVTGMYLAAQLHRLEQGGHIPHMSNYTLKNDVYSHAPRLCVSSLELKDMQWQALCDFVCALQQEFTAVFANSDVDIGLLLLCIFSRVGFFIAHKWPCETHDDLPAKLEASNMQHMSPDGAGYVVLHATQIAQLLDVLHALGGTSIALSRATSISEAMMSPKALELAQKISAQITIHHLEVSLDVFYELSMVYDLYIGSIVQYKHRHQEVFHSISQVVYYNWPSYARQKQLKLETIMAQRSALHILPLLLEMYPDIPCLYEHTGALHTDTHSKHERAFVVIAGNIFLVTKDMRVWHSSDLVLLLAHVLTESSP